MTSNISHSGEDPREFLSEHRDLIKRVRESQRATWFPLTILALVTFLAIPIEHFSRRKIEYCGNIDSQGSLGYVCHVSTPWGQIYWPIALILAYVAISNFYLKRSRSRGVETNVRNYVRVGILLSVILSLASLAIARIHVGRYDFLEFHLDEHSMSFILRLISPAGSIGLALLYLARFERNRILLFIDLAYLAIVLVPINFGWVVLRAPWGMLPSRIIDGTILLISGIGFALFQHRKQEEIL